MSNGPLDIHADPPCAELLRHCGYDDAQTLSAFARAIRPAARAPKDSDTRELADLLSRRRQLVDMRVQELNASTRPSLAQ